MGPTRLLVVCVGNYCRSPMGEAILRQRAAEAGASRSIEVASAGTSPFHVGGPPHPLTLAVLRDRGVDSTGLRGRAVALADFADFDRVLAVDRSVLRRLEELAHAASASPRRARLELILSHGCSGELDLFDPFVAAADRRGFERVFDRLDEACRGLVATLLAERTRAAAAGE